MPAPLIPWRVFFHALSTRKHKQEHLQFWLARWAFSDAGTALVDGEMTVSEFKRRAPWAEREWRESCRTYRPVSAVRRSAIAGRRVVAHREVQDDA